YQPIIDPFEPNDTFETGSPAELGEIIRPFIFPQKDANYFAVEVKSPGVLRARLYESNIDAALAILDPEGKVLTSNWAYGGAPIDISYQIYSKGLYRISVTSTNPNNFSLKASRLRVDLLRAEALLEDFAGGEARPKPIPFAKAIGGTIFPAGRRICYQISPDRSGLMRFRFQLSECDSRVTITDCKGKQLYSGWAYGTGFIAADVAIPQPGDYFIELSGMGPSQISLRSLFFRVYFYPNDEYEGYRENSIPETAAEISIRQDVAGVIARPGDIDYYRFYIDQPGLVTLYTGAFPLDLSFIVYGIDGKEVFNSWGYRDSVWNREFHVREKGYYLLKVQSTNGNAYSSSSYRFRLEIARIKPESTMEEGHLILNLNTGMKIDVLIPGSKKVLIIPVPKPATVTIGVKNPIDASMAITDSSGKELWSGWGYGGGVLQRTIKIESPTTLRAVLQGTNVNAWSKSQYFIYATEGKVPPEPAITCEQIMEDNRTVAFSVPGAARYEMDFEGNGQFKEIEPGLIQHKYEESRIYTPKVRITDESGAVSTESIYLDLQDIKLKGLSCRIAFPRDGEVVASPRAVFVQALTGPGGTVKEMKLYLDDKLIARSDSSHIDSKIPWTALSPGEHTIRAEAYAADGERAKETSRFQMGDVFDLWPEGGRTITGSRAVITWFSPQRNETLVEYRRFGAEKWERTVGQSGKQHRIMLEGLEFGSPYEFRAGDGKSWSDVRILTLQKGISFEQPRYGASIPREYGQSMPVTVRNSSDKPQEVVLECMPPAGEELLVGFVGEGSEDRPVQLEPGKIRQFMLALSAQDCVSELHRFSVHIRSKSGYSDQAEVEVRVKIPKVDLQWEELETNPNTLSKKLRLVNKGDGLTDLTVRVEPADAFRLRPAVEHALLPAGGSMDLWADPILYDGFSEAIGDASARSISRSFNFRLVSSVPDGSKVYRVNVDPGFFDAISAWYCTNKPFLQLLFKTAAYLECTVMGERFTEIPSKPNLKEWFDLWGRMVERERMERASESKDGLKCPVFKGFE
ncbi:MAG TPA: fibronectin type III domain-containing protein, partial [Methanotrichaceae archaeon]|nr:fibronectin type III domain-containing protein [Methanotrichaceae archaeon]